MSETINFFWLGDKLGLLEQLSLKSFLDHGHKTILWAYNIKCHGVPSGVIVNNANEILSEDRIFKYTGNGDCRVNSIGGFSDLFRYYLLNKVGGWYCDMDVTCLAPFNNINQEYVIRPHKNTKIVGNILKTPNNNSFLEDCIAETERLVDKDNDRWIKPLEILRDCVYKHGIDKFIVQKDWFGNDDIEEIRKMLNIGVFTKYINLPKYAIHWCNEAISTGRWDYSIKRDFNKPLPTTLFYNLLKKHELL